MSNVSPERPVDGLEDVVAARTVLSEVDGAAGRLILRGHALEELAGQTDFATAARLMFDGFFADLPAPQAFADALGRSRQEVFGEIAALDATLVSRSPIEALRALMARLPDGDDLTTALRFLAAPAVFTPAIVQAQRGLAPIAPDAALPHAQDILRMMNGQSPTQAQAAAIDAYLVTVCDHGLNASTFAARVVASTRAGLGSAVLAGLSALKAHCTAARPALSSTCSMASAMFRKRRPGSKQRWRAATG